LRVQTPERAAVISEIADTVVALHTSRVVRVGVDGVDGAGKTVFADELAEAVAALGRPTIRASVDGFHNTQRIRHRRGRTSPEGFFHDSYNYALLRELLLDPLTPGAQGRYRRAAFDHETDRPIETPWEHASTNAVLVFDGIFLHRPVLQGYWDYSIFLQVGFDVSIPRGARRGYGEPDPSAASNRRYVEGQTLYLQQCRPTDHASVVINNENLDEPRIIRSTNVAQPH
jgi:uridine kinase